MSGGEKKQLEKRFGTSEPQVAAGPVYVLFKSFFFVKVWERERPHSFSKPFEMLFLGSIRGPIRRTQRSKPLLICSREDHCFWKCWNMLICPGHPLHYRLWDEDAGSLWTPCQFVSQRDRRCYCFPSSSSPIFHPAALARHSSSSLSLLSLLLSTFHLFFSATFSHRRSKPQSTNLALHKMIRSEVKKK